MARILPPPFGKKVGVQKCVRVLQTGQMYLRATVQDGVSGLDKQLQLFFTAKVQICPLLSIHTLKSAMPVTKCVRNVQNACNFSK
jgi:hypothetical protein